ncbi:MAG: ABC transporter ATP-binding protein [Candidatus Moranbacteria bacterium]|nr:ABC transporter ATP-binding protein [Candidatus Moranbacteria bacterium]
MISCRNLTKIYNPGKNETLALDNISFDIAEGEFVAIMGPSGSGKSTLMHILGALDSPTGGQYFLRGKDLSKMSARQLAFLRREEIGFVFQSFNLLKRTSVLRNVMLPLVYAEVPVSERKAKAQKALNAVHIDPKRWNHLSNQISGGQMQRVAIARALINDPAIILADEPTGNLDTKTGQSVLKMFKELNEKEGHTIILITHEEDVAQNAERIITIRDGKILSDVKTL